MMLQCWEYDPDNRPSFKDSLNQLEVILRDFEDNSVIDGLPPLNEVNFDPYSYSEGNSVTNDILKKPLRFHILIIPNDCL
jgi:hypothetical protein